MKLEMMPERGETDPCRNCRVVVPYIVGTLSEPIANRRSLTDTRATGPPPARDLKALLSYTMGGNPVSTRRPLGREGRRLSAPTANGCLCVWTAASCKASLPAHILVQSGTYPPQGRRPARGQRAPRGAMGSCTTKPREPTITHDDGGYGGTVRYTIGVAHATATKKTAIGGDGPPELQKRGRCRDNASCEGSQLRLDAESEGACIDVHPSAAIYTRPSIPTEKQFAPLHQLIV